MVLPYHQLEDVFSDPARFEEAFFNHDAVREAFQSAREKYRQRAELGDDQELTGPTRAQLALSAFLQSLRLKTVD